jgi:hypothetical protein
MWIVPAGVTPSIATCQPCVLGCGEPCYDGGPVKLFDPQLWSLSDEELLALALAEGRALGGAEVVSPLDHELEGLYSIVEGIDGLLHSGDPLNIEEAWLRLKATRLLVINGSGTSYLSGMAILGAMVRELGRMDALGYYLAQVFGDALLGSSLNSAARAALAELFNRAAAEGITINVEAHSYSAYLIPSICATADCSTVNLIGYAPAITPGRWAELNDDWRGFEGTATIVQPSQDAVLAGTTYGGTAAGIAANPRLRTVNVGAGHSINDILQTSNFGQYAK